MLAVQDADSDLHYLRWTGSAWGADTEVETATAENKNQPFVFVWDAAPPTTPFPPIARDDSAGTIVDTPVDIDVLANDGDPNNDPLSAQSVTQGANGTVVNNGSDVNYSPERRVPFTGADTFSYTVTDGNGGTDTATVSVIVVPGNGFLVNSTADRVDSNIGDGTCSTGLLVGSDPECTLRAAVQESNASAIVDDVYLPAGTYTLTITGSEDAAIAGDLDITDTLTITGLVSAATTIVQAGTTTANGIDRVFHVRSSGSLTITDMTVRHGIENDGAGIRRGGRLIVEDSVVTANADEQGRRRHLQQGSDSDELPSDARRSVQQRRGRRRHRQQTGSPPSRTPPSTRTAPPVAAGVSQRCGPGHGQPLDVRRQYGRVRGRWRHRDRGGRGILTVTNSTFTTNAAGRNGGGVDDGPTRHCSTRRSPATAHRAMEAASAVRGP